MNQTELMKVRVLEMLDENNPYTQNDFEKEFSNFAIIGDEYKRTLEFVNKSNNPDPEYSTNGSSGFDLRANLGYPIIVKPFHREMVPTGLHFNIPDNLEIQVRSRSGLAAKQGITMLTGTVDADYIGEVKVILINLGEEDWVINHGDRIAQGVVVPVVAKRLLNLTKVEKIEKHTERGENGFGSTGHK